MRGGSCVRDPLTLPPARPAYPTTFPGYLHIGRIREGVATEALDLASIDAPWAITGSYSVLRAHRLPMLGIDAAGHRALRHKGVAGGHRTHKGRPYELMCVPLDPSSLFLDDDQPKSEAVNEPRPEEMSLGVGLDSGQPSLGVPLVGRPENPRPPSSGNLPHDFSAPNRPLNGSAESQGGRSPGYGAPCRSGRIPRFPVVPARDRTRRPGPRGLGAWVRTRQ